MFDVKILRSYRETALKVSSNVYVTPNISASQKRSYNSFTPSHWGSVTALTTSPSSFHSFQHMTERENWRTCTTRWTLGSEHLSLSPFFCLAAQLSPLRFMPILKREIDEIVDAIYTTGYPIIDTVHPHKLSVFFSLMAQGLSFSREASAALVQEQYHALACAMLSLDPITRGVTVSTVQAFFLIVRFLNSTVRTAAEDCWILFGICVRVSQTVCHTVLGSLPMFSI